MERYSVEFKKEVVDAYKRRELTTLEIATKYKVSKQTIMRWTSEYDSRGIEGITPKRINMKYSGEFKQMVVEDMINNRLSQSEVSKKYLIARHQVQSWEHIYLEKGVEGLYQKQRGQTSSYCDIQKEKNLQVDKSVEKDLLTELQRLRMEIDYLKKLNALVLKEEQQNRKRK